MHIHRTKIFKAMSRFTASRLAKHRSINESIRVMKFEEKKRKKKTLDRDPRMLKLELVKDFVILNIFESKLVHI